MTVEDAALITYSATEVQCCSANECLQLNGGYGYTADNPISRFYVDVHIIRQTS